VVVPARVSSLACCATTSSSMETSASLNWTERGSGRDKRGGAPARREDEVVVAARQEDGVE